MSANREYIEITKALVTLQGDIISLRRDVLAIKDKIASILFSVGKDRPVSVLSLKMLLPLQNSVSSSIVRSLTPPAPIGAIAIFIVFITHIILSLFSIIVKYLLKFIVVSFF
jgi:hypothetical protein